MMKSISEIAEDQYGRKVLLYLLAPRDPTHFHPKIVEVLQKGDDNPTRYCRVPCKCLTRGDSFSTVKVTGAWLFPVIWFPAQSNRTAPDPHHRSCDRPFT